MKGRRQDKNRASWAAAFRTSGVGYRLASARKGSGRVWLTGLLLSCIPVLFLSCGDSNGGRPLDGLGGVERLGDTVFVQNVQPIHSDTGRLVEILSIGALAEPPEQVINGLTSFVRGPAGQVFIADRDGIREFGPDGRFRGVVAGVGEGPGEVGMVMGMETTFENRLLAYDLRNRRINVYDLESGALDHWPMPGQYHDGGRISLTALDDGRILVFFAPSLPSDGSERPYPKPIFLVMDNLGEVLDTVAASSRFLEECPFRSSRSSARGNTEDVRGRYLPKVKWAAGPNGTIAVGCPATYSIDLISEDGVIRRVTRDRFPIRISSQERREYSEGLRGQREADPRRPPWGTSPGDIPEEKPAYHRFFFGRSGRLWVWTSQPSLRTEMTPEMRARGAPTAIWLEPTSGSFDVFEPTGEFLGVVALPPDVPYDPTARGLVAVRDFDARGDTVWAVKTDSYGTEYVSKYLLRW